MEIESEFRNVYTFSPGPCSLPLKLQDTCYDTIFNYEGIK